MNYTDTTPPKQSYFYVLKHNGQYLMDNRFAVTSDLTKARRFNRWQDAVQLRSGFCDSWQCKAQVMHVDIIPATAERLVEES